MGSRVVPHVGMEVTIRHLDAEVAGEIEVVEEGGRRLLVRSSDGSQTTFTLRGATGTFHAPAHGPRLLLRPPLRET